jgi:ribosome-associated toxin RatA of RatAB toxin-antitoxin module
VGGAARADGLSAGETDRLLRGDSVARTQELRRGLRRYVGGVAYKIIDASADDLASLLDDVNAWSGFLPKTRDARRVGAIGDDPLVQITHGSALVQVAYTLRVHRDGNSVRFSLASGRPHDIEDIWGFFRAEPLPDGRTVVTYGILIDMGDGILRDMFESRVRELALEVPDHLGDVVAQRQARGRRAAR